MKIKTRNLAEPDGELKEDHEGLDVQAGANNFYRFRMPRVFTVFCHGTGGHRAGRCKELITEFGAAYWDRGDDETPNQFYQKHYQKSFLILDGVGTCDMYFPEDSTTEIGLPENHTNRSISAHPMPGDFIATDLRKPLKPAKVGGITVHARVSEMGSAPGKHRGDLMGDGWNDNVAHALFVLRELQEKHEFPDVINLIGWSRGAVTTIKLAYWIHEYFVEGSPFRIALDYQKKKADELGNYPGLPADPVSRVDAAKLAINIFAIDPVPGRFGKRAHWGGSNEEEEDFPPKPGEQDYRSLKPTVRNCIITLAMDERRSGFAPICAGTCADGPKLSATSTDTKLIWLPFPGIHRTQLRLEPRDPWGSHDVPPVASSLTAVPKVVWDLAWQFLTFHGTIFERNICARWAGTQEQDASIKKRQLDIYAILDLYADMWLNRANYHRARNQDATKGAKVVMAWRWRKFTGYRGLGMPDLMDKAGRKAAARNRRGVADEHLWTPALGVYTEAPGFFINEHHRWCFQKAYPETYQFLIETRAERDQPETVPENVCGELAHIADQQGQLWVMLQQAMGLEGHPAGDCSWTNTQRRGALAGKPLAEWDNQHDRVQMGENPADARFTGKLEEMKAADGGPHLLQYLTDALGSGENGSGEGPPREPDDDRRTALLL
jgi:hypothetical protein